MKSARLLKLATILCFAITTFLGCQSTQPKDTADVDDSNDKKVAKKDDEKKTRRVRKTAKKSPSKSADKKNKELASDNKNDDLNNAKAVGKSPEDAKRLEDLAKGMTLRQQSKKVGANYYYKSGFEHYKALRYRMAEKDLLTCLEYDANHRQAKLLLNRVRYILGDRRGAIHDVARDYIQERKVKIAQTKIELDRLFSAAKAHYSQKNYKKSKEKLERILELVRWFPYYIVDNSYMARVKEMIRKTEKRQKEYDLEMKRKLQEAAQERARFLHAQNLKYVAAQVRALYRQAQLAFRQEEYNTVVDLCDEILHLRPEYRRAAILKQQSINAQHVKKQMYNIRQQTEHFSRQIEYVDSAAIPYQEVFRFPDREKWKVIQNRANQVTTIFTGEEDISSAEAEIKNRLENQPVSVNFRKTPFAEAIAFLRQVSGLNFVISNSAETIVRDNDIKVTLPLENVKIKNALELILNANRELTYKIKNGSVYITTREDEKAKLFIHFYNVADIINDLPNFPAPKLALTAAGGNSGAGGGAAPGGGGVLIPDDGGGEQTTGAGVNAEKLMELINKRIGESADEGSVSISNGVLIVRKPIEAHKKVQKLLAALRKTVGVMVTVEVKFIDIQDNLLREVGVDYRGLPTNIVNIDGAGTNQNIGYRFVDAQGQNDTRAALVNTFSTGLGTTANNPFNVTSLGGLAVQYNKLSFYQLQFIFEAVKKKQKARVVNAPRVNVFNTQRAHVLSINQRAFIQDVEVDSTGVVPVLNPVVGILNFGSILEARPTVSHDRKYVTLEIKPTLAVDRTTAANTTTLNLAGGNTNIPIELPILTVQKIRTTVTVPDGGTILVGGLKNYIKEKKISGVPIVNNIPILKNLFTRRGWTHLRRSLVVLLTVKIHVIRDIEKRKFGGIR